MAKKRKLKFGSPAWRKKYAAKAKRNRAAGNKKRPAKKKTAKRSNKARVLRNPPRKWTKVRLMRVVKDRHGAEHVEFKK